MAPIIVTASFGTADFSWLDGMRRQHFPPERNQVPAHLTLFHHLPPSVVDEVVASLKAEARVPRPAATLAAVIRMDRGVAFRVESPGLAEIRKNLAARFDTLLVAQDQQGWRAHVTIQNKAEPAAAKGLHAELSADFAPRPLAIAGLAAWWYRGGPWEPIAEARFR